MLYGNNVDVMDGDVMGVGGRVRWRWKSVRPTVYRITFFIMENAVDVLYDKLLRFSVELNCVCTREDR